MSAEIWKWRLEVMGVQMPTGAFIVLVHEQHGDPCVWAQVDPEKEVEVRRFEIVGTGHSFDPATRVYRGSALCGPFVWHVLEVIDPVPSVSGE